MGAYAKPSIWWLLSTAAAREPATQIIVFAFDSRTLPQCWPLNGHPSSAQGLSVHVSDFGDHLEVPAIKSSNGREMSSIQRANRVSPESIGQHHQGGVGYANV